MAPSAVPGWTSFIHPVSGVSPSISGESSACRHVMIACRSVEVTLQSAAGQGRVRARSDADQGSVRRGRNRPNGTLTAYDRTGFSDP